MQQTLIVLKPDALQRRLVGRILQRFEDADLSLTHAEMRYMDSEFVRRHYRGLAERRGPNVLQMLEEYMISGCVLACRFEGTEAVRNCRRLVGPTIPAEAPPGTIRGDFGHVSEQAALSRGVSVMNLIHASGTEEEARYELALWFPALANHLT